MARCPTLTCPNCGSPTSRVVMVKHVDDDHTLRRRHCPECDHRWYTAQGREQSIETWRVHWTGRKTIELLPENEVQ